MKEYYKSIIYIGLISFSISLNGMNNHNKSTFSVVKSAISILMPWITRAYLCFPSFMINFPVRMSNFNTVPMNAEQLMKSSKIPLYINDFLIRQSQRLYPSIDNILFAESKSTLIDVAAAIKCPSAGDIIAWNPNIKDLSSQEIDFAMNHEIAHIKLYHNQTHAIKNWIGNIGVEVGFFATNYALRALERKTKNNRIKSICRYTVDYITDNPITSSVIKLLLSSIISASISRNHETQADVQAVKWLGTNEGAVSYMTKCLHDDNIVQNFIKIVLLQNPCWESYKDFISVLPILVRQIGLLKSHPFFFERLKSVS